MECTPRRRWFRFAFSLRTLFVIVTLAALLFGWVAYNYQIVSERKQLLQELRTSLGSITLAHATLETGEAAAPQSAGYMEPRGHEYARVGWIRRALGDESCVRLAVPTEIDPALRERIERAFPEVTIQYGDQNAGFRFRESLYIPRPAIK